ncbi:rfbP protein [Vibrio sp. A11]|nr:rfbP protein [Vibrio sp. A11]
MKVGLSFDKPTLIVIPKPPPWAVVIEPWGYCPKKCPC